MENHDELWDKSFWPCHNRSILAKFVLGVEHSTLVGEFPIEEGDSTFPGQISKYQYKPAQVNDQQPFDGL